MPAFFFLSGYLFNYIKYKNSSFNKFVKNRFNRLMFPYFATFIIGIFLISTATILSHTHTFIIGNVENQIVAMLLGNAGHYHYIESNFNVQPIWFLPCLFCGNVLLYGFLKLFDGRKVIFGLLGSLVMVGLGLISGKYVFPLGLDIALVSLIFMYSGYLSRQCMIFDKISNSRSDCITLLAFTILILVGIEFYYNKEDAYKEGQAYENGLPLAGDLAFRAHFGRG
jgi:fucose 4-O-acetylase-like acetyltransferase